MKRKLKILLSILLLSLTAFSQIDTSKVCIPTHKARLIAADLLRGDSAIAELKSSQFIIKQLRTKLEVKENIINTYVVLDQKNDKIMEAYRQKEDKYEYIVAGLERDVKRYKRRVKILGVTCGVAAITVVVGLLVP